MADKRDWMPREQPGGIYCSPACGCRCKRADYDKALQEATAMAAELGEGWRARVWENMGWHYSADKAHASVHANIIGGRVRSYTAFINGERQVVGSGNTGREAFEDGLSKLDGMIAQLQREREALR
jgi:hypothetical protein